jgi:hypothetical protein
MSTYAGYRTSRARDFFSAGRAALMSLVLILSLSGLSACITKAVLPPSASEIGVSFSLAPPAALQLGSQTTLTVNVINDVSNAGVDWVASCSSANCGSFNPTHTASGVATVYTAPASAPAGNSVNLSARATASPSESVTVTVNIFSSISITLVGFPASPLAAGSTTQVTAKVTGDPNNLGVDWTLLCPVGNCGTITQQTASNVPATFTAPAIVTSSFNVTITATSVFDPTQTVTTNLTVSPSGAVSIAFGQNPPPPTAMNTSATASIVANVSGDTSNAGVNWTVSCTNSSNTCGTFNPSSPAHTASGAPMLYTAPATVPANGLSVTITATAAASPNPFVTAAILVTAAVPTIGPISGAPTSLPVKGTAKVSAVVTNDSSSNGGVNWLVTCTPAPTSNCGTFSSGLATDHTASGVQTTYTAPAIIPLGSPAGNVTITATSTANPASSSTAVFPIIPSTSISINFATGANAPPANLITNQTASIAANVTNDSLTPPNGVNWSVTCASTGAGACGSFGAANTASGAPVVYTAPPSVPTGITVTITATAAASPGTSVSATVTILPPSVMITVTAGSPLDAGSDEQISAVVTGDSTKAGVTWSVSCTPTNAAGCGTFNPVSSPATNNPTTSYTAPASVPTGDVTITATSLAAGVSAVGTAQVTISPNPNLGLLNGPYALFLTGVNSAGFYEIAGSVTADGLGDITVGAEDIDGLANVCAPSSNFTPVTGTYSVGPDGRGTMTLETGNSSCFGDAGVQTLSFAVVGAPGTSVQRALVTEFDNATASGSLDLQTLSTNLNAISGNYAFTLAGLDIVNPPNLADISTADVGGVFTSNGSGTITSGFQDENDQATGLVTKKQAITGTYTAPDPSTGRGTITFGTSSLTQFEYVYYLVNSGQIKLLAYDVTNDLIDGGSAYLQGSFSGQYAFSLSGVDGTLGTPIVAGGLFDAGAGTSLTAGAIDVNDGGVLTTDQSFTGTVTPAVSGRGTFTLSGTTAGLTTFAFYPTANNGVLLLDLDAGFAAIGTSFSQIGGINAGTFSGNYAMDLTGPVSGSPEEDADGVVNSDGSSLLTGTADVNGGTTSDAGAILLTGGYTSNANGRFTGHLSLALSGTDTQTFQEIFYILNNNTLLFIENDSNGQTSGIMQLQNLTIP